MMRRVVKFVAIAMLATVATASHAYPDRPIKIIVPFGPGSSVDAVARRLGNALSDVVKQSVIIDNKPGAEGAIGAQALTSAPPDGYTALVTSSSLPVLAPLMNKSIPFDPVKDFAPVCAVARVGNVMNMRSSLPFNTLGEFLAAAKAAPGKYTFAYSSATTRLAGELLQQETGIKLLGVPYKSTAAGLMDVVAGRVDLFFVDHISVGAFYQSGKIKALAVTGSQRLKSLPSVPTMAESGVPSYELYPWFALYVPMRTPQQVVAQLREATRKALETPALQDWMETSGLENFIVCGEDLTKLQLTEMERWARVIKKANIEPQ
jgi:tripartite-type tricarboxylate transporter receptor subunit TctC